MLGPKVWIFPLSCSANRLNFETVFWLNLCWSYSKRTTEEIPSTFLLLCLPLLTLQVLFSLAGRLIIYSKLNPKPLWPFSVTQQRDWSLLQKDRVIRRKKMDILIFWNKASFDLSPCNWRCWKPGGCAIVWDQLLSTVLLFFGLPSKLKGAGQDLCGKSWSHNDCLLLAISGKCF